MKEQRPKHSFFTKKARRFLRKKPSAFSVDSTSNAVKGLLKHLARQMFWTCAKDTEQQSDDVVDVRKTVILPKAI
jgi:hypothetical protein